MSSYITDDLPKGINNKCSYCHSHKDISYSEDFNDKTHCLNCYECHFSIEKHSLKELMNEWNK